MQQLQRTRESFPPHGCSSYSMAVGEKGSRVKRWQINQQITWRNKLKAGQQIKPDRRQFPFCNWNCHSNVKRGRESVSWWDDGLWGRGIIKCPMCDKVRTKLLKTSQGTPQCPSCCPATHPATKELTHLGSFRDSNWMHSEKSVGA